jgi:peptidoglycan-associated lipoprotein
VVLTNNFLNRTYVMTVLKSVKTTAGIALAALILAGCSSTSTTDSDDTMVDTTPVEAQPVAPLQVEVEDAFIIGTVLYFDFDKSELRADVRASLDERAEALQSKSGVLRLEGHADERGTREYNMALGERRAKAVANYLSSQGVPASQIETVSYGEEKPAMLGGGSEAMAKNRRVELIYSE